MPGRIGLVDLRDLASRYAWHGLKITPALSDAELEPAGPAEARFEPPDVVLAIVPYSGEELVHASRAWLEDAAHVFVLRVPGEPFDDPEVERHAEEQWRALALSFTVRVELADYRSPADLRAAVARAQATAAELDERSPPPAPPSPRELARSPRFELVTSARPIFDERSVIAWSLLAGPGEPALDSAHGVVSLEKPPPVVTLEDRRGTRSRLPDGRLLERQGRSPWRIDDRNVTVYGHLALGFAPHHHVGWTGVRMMVFWVYVGKRDVGVLSASDHDFPCGPSKKLYGYEDNDPVRVDLAPDLSFVAYHFEHDVLLTSAIPISWRKAGPLEVADFPRDPRRAVFFVRDEDDGRTDLLDEDVRSHAPVIVLGNSPAIRYALDLGGSTYRIDGTAPNQGTAVHVGGPETAFGVFDVEHRLVRRGSGRLLGGSHGVATVLEHGELHRERLTTGARTPLGSCAGNVLFALPLPGTVNVLVVTEVAKRRFAELV